MSNYARCSRCDGSADTDSVICLKCVHERLEAALADEDKIHDETQKMIGKYMEDAERFERERDEALQELTKERARLDAMIAGAWSVEQWPPGGRWIVHNEDSRVDMDYLPVGYGETPRAAIDAARKEEA